MDSFRECVFTDASPSSALRRCGPNMTTMLDILVAQKAERRGMGEEDLKGLACQRITRRHSRERVNQWAFA